ncbi:MAG TPA: DUF4279 domain-containing protein [Fimbriimonas sp.]|nr:DUF4279 domain-containing protein [Fimbriimonas sp.]
MVVTNYPEVKLYFRFYGEAFDPDEITRRLKIEPTIQRRPGDPLTQDGRGVCRDYSWMVKIGPSEILDIDDMLHELRRRINVAPDDVKRLCADLNLDLVIVCGVGGEEADTMPAMFFPTEFLEWVVSLGASLNVDVIA